MALDELHLSYQPPSLISSGQKALQAMCFFYDSEDVTLLELTNTVLAPVQQGRHGVSLQPAGPGNRVEFA